jgi:hypothetical protein
MAEQTSNNPTPKRPKSQLGRTNHPTLSQVTDLKILGSRVGFMVCELHFSRKLSSIVFRAKFCQIVHFP